MDKIGTAGSAVTGGAHAVRAMSGLLAALLCACSGSGGADAPTATGQAAAGASGQTRSGAEPAELNVYNWSDYIAEDTVRNFEARTGIRVNYNTFSSLQGLQDVMEGDPDTYDVIFPSERPLARDMVAAGRLRPLDKAALPHLKNLDPSVLADLARFDTGNAHVVPYLWGTTGIGMNVDRVRAVLGPNAALDTWDLLFDRVQAEKLSQCGIGILDDPLEPISAALIRRGMDPGEESQAALDQVKTDFMAIRPYVRKFTGSSELIDDLANGDLCLVLSYSGDVIQAQTQTAEREGGPEIRYIVPREGALRWTDVIGIPRNAKHPANAHAFIDYLMEAEVIASITNYVAYANANRASASLIDADVAEDPAIYPSAATQAKLRGISELSADASERRRITWIKVVYGEI